jgi:hypothetical protein
MTATLHSTPTIGLRHDEVNYVARRVVAACGALVVIAVLFVAAFAVIGALVEADAGSVAASGPALSSADTPIVRVHVAQPGDTLWSIADRYRGDVGHGRYVDALIDVNGGTTIQIGQAVRLP